MGTDIHGYLELRQEDGSWRKVAKIDSDRSYLLFAALADVRNGVGFAGCVTGDPITPIGPLKGVPEDASAEFRALVERWEDDGHSHSFFTLAELLAYDWTRPKTERGWVPLRGYSDWRGPIESYGHPPRGAYASINGPCVQHLQREQADALLKGGLPDSHEDMYVQCQWTQPFYKASGGAEWHHLIAPMLGFSTNHDAVRAVFFFDN